MHRFSHGTMPLRNIFKVSILTLSALPTISTCPPQANSAALFQNCTYYWGFAAWMAYYINHPLYTPPSKWSQTMPSPCDLIITSSYGALLPAFSAAYGAQQVKLALTIFVVKRLGRQPSVVR